MYELLGQVFAEIESNLIFVIFYIYKLGLNFFQKIFGRHQKKVIFEKKLIV